MPNHSIGSNHTFGNLTKAFNADVQEDGDAHFLLYRGDEILALCLRYKFNPKPDEVWIGNDSAVTAWGQRLASLKGQRSLPVYYSPRGRTMYQFKGQHLITGDTTDPKELSERKGPVPISRVVFLKEIPQASPAK